MSKEYKVTSKGWKYHGQLVREDERLTDSWTGEGPAGLNGEPERDLMVLEAVWMEEEDELKRPIFRAVIRRLFEAGYIDHVR